MKINGITSYVPHVRNGNVSIHGKKQVAEKSHPDKIEISNTARVFDKIDNFLNMNGNERLNLADLSEAEKEEFFKMLHSLIRKGIVGYEYLEVNGKKEKHFLSNEIGDERIYGAKRWRERKIFKPKVK